MQMRLSISNIAWDPAEDISMAALLQHHNVDAIDIAPGKYFPDPGSVDDLDIARLKAWWADRGIDIVGMQSLLFGTQGLNVFGDQGSQDAMLNRLGAVCRIGAQLGATRLVFGSPKNRDRQGLGDEEALEKAAAFFSLLGNLAGGWGVKVCLEPNPPRYGANFMTTAAETERVVRHVDHPAIRMQFDTGALTISGEEPQAVLHRCADIIGHVHASEPDLVPLGDGVTPHVLLGGLLRRQLPAHPVSIEMVATVAEPHLRSVERALRVAHHAYRLPMEDQL